jgi:hypothetical protein
VIFEENETFLKDSSGVGSSAFFDSGGSIRILQAPGFGVSSQQNCGLSDLSRGAIGNEATPQ